MGQIFQLFAVALLWLVSFAARAADGGGDGGGDGGVLGSMVGLVKKIVAYVKGAYDSIAKFVDWCGKLAVAVFEAAWDMITDAMVWCVEGLLKMAAGAIKGVADAFKLDTLAQQVRDLWNMVPPEVVEVLQSLGIASALSIIVAGIIIRFALQLIPFTRLGS